MKVCHVKVTLFGIVADLRFLQSSKAALPISLSVDAEKEVIPDPQNARNWMSLTVEGIVTDLKLLVSLNAQLAIVVSPLGRDTDSRFVAPQKQQ